MIKKNTWTQGWLEYHSRNCSENEKFLKHIYVVGFEKESRIVGNAVTELRSGIRGMAGIIPRLCKADIEANVKVDIKADTKTDIMMTMKSGLYLVRVPEEKIGKEGYVLRKEEDRIFVEASDENGLLYGVFHMLRLISMEKKLEDALSVPVVCSPDQPLRMLNHWDNMDGSIERGYSGNSFFYENNKIIINRRTRDYCRMASSVGINGIVINNVNVKDAATLLITPKYLGKVKILTDLFAEYGIRLYLSLNFAAAIELGGLDSADPFDEKVIAWWEEKIAEVYKWIPNLGGFLVKADSEGRPGPFTYGRTQADGANMLAKIAKKYDSTIIWRCFVYNCQQDWRDYKTDRARAGYDNFIHTDGDYLDNVILQIKNGPMDFQIREPISPLFGAMPKTNQMLEVQIAQEYTGQQIDLCYLVPMMKEILSFRTYCAPEHDTVAEIVSGKCYGNTKCGFAAVTNTGNDANWTGNDLAAANLYGFGRLAYANDLSAEEIAEEWICQTLSCDEEVVKVVKEMLLNSREVYERYTCPLGIGWMVNPHYHYGPNVDGYEYDRWGTYHRADWKGIGVDRSTNGTGYASQYFEPNFSMYNNPETCPEELLLFFHHIPYEYKLKTGKILIQHIYDTHFQGVEEVEGMIAAWKSLESKIDSRIFATVAERFQRQLRNAKEWRDQVNTYFYRKCGIGDEKNRKIYE